MARSTRAQKASLTIANLLLPIAVLIFASGFFPYKPVLPGLATFEEDAYMERYHGEEFRDNDNDKRSATARPRPMFDRVVFMVVDALRSDFVYGYGSGFEFTQSLIRTGAAVPFTAHATPPTVTMPRIKALTTGSVPSFLDLILNFAESDTSSSLSSQDTWLAQIAARGGPLVFFGDDTWLKLFPADGFFRRADGTSSFFVSDFTEVDANVTRHLPSELQQQDWSAMILHYLGLDHIGHKTGPQGPNMLPKQREMDGIVEMIYNAMASDGHMKDTLLVLAGDHGMNGGGNHGGSGPGETEPALLFASPKFATAAMAAGRTRPTYECPTKPKDGTEFHYYTKVEQSDLVPTLAGLMGLPISRNSLGVAIPELAGFLGGAREEVALLRRNAAQILRVVEATYGEARWKLTLEMVDAWRAEECAAAEGEAELACRWLRARRAWDRHDDDDDDDDDDGLHIDALRTFLLAAQAALSGTASSYNLARMAGGMVLTAGIVAATLASLPPVWPPSPVGVFFALASILYGIMMFASSYVEEEQQFWYWVTPAWLLALAVLRLPAFRSPRDRLRGGLAVLAALAVHRVQTRWNQTGQKHAGDADIAHTLFPDRHVSMWLLILATYAYVGVMLVRRTAAAVVAPELAVVVAAVVVLPALVFKLNFTQADAPELVRGLAAGIRAWSAPFDLVVQARVAFAALAAATLAVVGLAVASHRASWSVGLRERGLLPSLTERLHYLLMLFLITQTRAPNVPVLLGMEVQREAVAYLVGFESGASSSSSSSSSSRNGTAAPRVTAVAATVLLFSHVSFFCMGGSNSISSIDLSNAYNGVADYNIVAVGVLLFASNWTGPIWWCSAANLLLAHRPGRSIFAAPIPSQGLAKNGRSWIDDERKRMHEDALQAMMGPEKKTPTSVHGVWMQYLSCMTAFVAVSLLAVMAGCTALRTHLFIWTVFSPKYLYAMAWSMGWHLLVNVGLGSLWHRLSTVA